MPMKNSNDTIGNRTCDLPACRAVPRMREVNRENQIDEVKIRFFRRHQSSTTFISRACKGLGSLQEVLRL